jgi:hypothetical protein
MRRKVSLWIVIALVGALAATAAGVIVLATHHERDSRAVAGPRSSNAWPHAWNDGQDQRPMPMMGDARGGWGDGRDAPVLPWVLFALATGTAVARLVAWSPWRTAGAGAKAGTAEAPPAQGVTAGEAAATAVETQAVDTQATDQQTTAEIVEGQVVEAEAVETQTVEAPPAEETPQTPPES